MDGDFVELLMIPIIINRALATKIGVDGAVLIGALVNHGPWPSEKRDGRYWVLASDADLERRLPFWSGEYILYLRQTLEKRGVLHSRPSDNRHAGNWYAIDLSDVFRSGVQ